MGGLHQWATESVEDFARPDVMHALLGALVAVVPLLGEEQASQTGTRFVFPE